MHPKESVTVIARIKFKPGREDEIAEAFKELVSCTHAEEGCVDYILHTCTGTPGLFLFYENWTSKEHLDRHLASSHLKAFRQRTDEMLAEPVEITLWDKV